MRAADRGERHSGDPCYARRGDGCLLLRHHVRILTPDGDLLGKPFLDIRHKIIPFVSDFDERGLSGLAFHPDFANNGKFYVSYSGLLAWQGDLAKKVFWDRRPAASHDIPSQILLPFGIAHLGLAASGRRGRTTSGRILAGRPTAAPRVPRPRKDDGGAKTEA